MKTNIDHAAPQFDLEISDLAGSINLENRHLIENRSRFALRRFASRIRHLRMSLVDENGPKGGRDTRCKIRLKLEGRGEVVADAIHVDPLRASTDAISKARRQMTEQKRFQRR